MIKKEITPRMFSTPMEFTWEAKAQKKNLHHIIVDENEFDRINIRGIVTIIAKDNIAYVLNDFVQIIQKDSSHSASFSIVKIDTGLEGFKKGYFLMTISRLQYTSFSYESLEK